MSRMLDIGLSGLLSHTRALEVTSHNVANAATPGYSRQRADLTTASPESTKPGQIGRGVTVSAIVRTTDNLLVARLRDAQSDQGRYATLAKTVADVELAFNEPGDAGLSAVIDNAFRALEDLAANPELSALRAGTAQNLRTFTSMVNRTANDLARQSDSLLLAMQSEVASANDLIDQIAELNGQITRELAVGRNPNDLMDRRDTFLTELATLADTKVRTDPNSGGVLVEIAGRNLIAGVNASHLEAELQGDGLPAIVVRESGESAAITGGRLGAYLETARSVLPAVREEFDALVLTLMGELNAIHAIGTSDLAHQQVHLSERILDGTLTGIDLDDTSHVLADNSRVGIPEPLLPLFTNADGVPVARNLTINVLDTTSGLAEKFVVRYEPGNPAAPASRSLDDLVAAINSGRGGGFSVHPPQAGGVAGVRARLASADGGVRLELRADAGHSIDFSPALDLRPAANAWTSDPVQVSGSDASLAGQRLLFAVNGANLDTYTLDQVSGAAVAYGSVAIGALPAAVGALTVSLPGGATFVNGETFAIDFDAAGAQVGGSPTVQARTWVAGDAGFDLRGRYTGDHAYDPDRPWTARVVQGGTIGSDSNPPMVSFTWYSGSDDSRVEETTTVRLDSSHPAGSQVAIGAGIYAVFDAGSLTVGGDGVELVVDGQGDQARLLPALGINTLFSGRSASEIAVAERIQRNPDLLAVARSRAPGDNSNVLALAAARGARIHGDGELGLDNAYQSLVSDVGVRVNQARELTESQTLVTASLENRRESISGVSIDEEIANLILQQQAYAASARIISMARENIQTLMEMLR